MNIIFAIFLSFRLIMQVFFMFALVFPWCTCIPTMHSEKKLLAHHDNMCYTKCKNDFDKCTLREKLRCKPGSQDLEKQKERIFQCHSNRLSCERARCNMYFVCLEKCSLQLLECTNKTKSATGLQGHVICMQTQDICKSTCSLRIQPT